MLSGAAAGYAQSKILVVKCKDPWINQAYIDLYQRDPVVRNPSVPNAVDGECNMNLYGGGHWTSYTDLENKIIAVKGPRRVYSPATVQAIQRPASSTTTSSASSISSGITVDTSHGVVIDHGVSTPLSEIQIKDQAGNLLSPAAVAQIVAAGGGNIVAAGGGNATSSGPSNCRVGGGAAPKKVYMLIRK